MFPFVRSEPLVYNFIMETHCVFVRPRDYSRLALAPISQLRNHVESQLRSHVVRYKETCFLSWFHTLMIIKCIINESQVLITM